MEVTERFVLNDLMDNTWSVCWPGYEYVVVNNPGKASTLLKILFDTIGVDEVLLGVHEYNKPDNFETMHINLAAWLQDPKGTSMHVVAQHVVTECKFVEREHAEKFKLHMEQRLAWKRLSAGKAWA